MIYVDSHFFIRILKVFLLIFYLFIPIKSIAEILIIQKTPIPVEVGLYVDQLYDLDSNKGTFSANITYWAKIPKEVTMPLTEIEVREIYSKHPVINDNAVWTAPIDTDKNYSVQSLKGTFLHNYDLRKFPFDVQKFTISFELPENSDNFKIIDDSQSSINKKIQLDGWSINSFKPIITNISHGTNFGWSPDSPDVEYSRLSFEIYAERNAVLLFFKLSLGLFAAVTLALLASQISTSNGDEFSARIGLIGGALLAIIVNQQFADVKIGDSTSVTLIDALHINGIIVIIILFIVTILTRQICIHGNVNYAIRFDKIASKATAVFFVLVSFLLIFLSVFY
jgi:hypothetical protein